jgi:type IV pilus assembly protein PilY1
LGGAQPGFCPRAIGSGPNANQADNFSGPTYWDLSDSAGVKRRGNVRKWAANCKDAVAGRNLLVVRLDTGEILRIFGRVAQDVPDRVDAMGTKVPFDSPLVGTPVVYPSGPGQIGQKIYIGDADGTIWRLDISNGDPTKWFGSLFWDTQNTDVIGAGLTPQQQADRSQPVSVPPILSLDDRGNMVVSVATGDQDTLVDTSPAQNFVYSITESPTFSGSATSKPVKATANWWYAMSGGERVTGPMAVFDKTHYFATFKPPTAVGACTGGHAYIYGWHYTQQRTPGVPASGGTYRYPAAAPALREEPFAGVAGEGQVIPGVSVVGSLPCFDGNDIASYGEYGAKLSSTEYSLFVTVAAGSTGGSKTYGGGSQSNLNVGAPKGLLPSTTEKTRVDSWVAVVE